MDPIKATVSEPVTDTRPEPPPMEPFVWAVIYQVWLDTLKRWNTNVGYWGENEEGAKNYAKEVAEFHAVRNVRVVRIDTGDKA